ncbi:benzoyl-CoA 2,3-epoxidase subunit BoxA [Marinobacterium mangrovicola]|uniref:Benzoyl-CoA oxygenase subunit A n=1 Tax=Marinobacterium mangrovicola TaxID=1476959 RepID=A0A4V2PDY0_9GAMM|nr:benzoyl-CoA 2,3-epoxidase subunit BoxA [Marinobacterium mangrovicola]TCK06976.1 benzoyl-CoA oxygenase subunit A [Marinobacterium mangrovicola]
MTALRQHLIDPEVCIRCNTCEENCPIEGAIEHNEDNYVVNADLCNYCMSCISPCPTGAIDSWRVVENAYSLDDQYSWDELPEQIEIQDSGAEDGSEASESEATDILEIAHAGNGIVPAPATSSKPRINLWTREKPARATVTGNYRITEEGTESDIHHIVLDFGAQSFPVLEGQSIGIIPPGTDAKGKPHQVRLYSIASPRDGERPGYNNLALTVKRVTFEADGATQEGLGSGYMCNLKKNDEVMVTGPFGSTFLMPNDPDANLIMICTGTGAAPFRGMTERRRRLGGHGKGKMLLFFGARSPSELPYFGPLQKLPKSLLDQELVFSRISNIDDSNKEYVQHRMAKRAEDLAALLNDENTHIYVCGLKGMEQGVEETFNSLCADRGLDWPQLRQQLRNDGRYHIETY